MKAKVLGISGSPRKNGNTDRMINYVLQGASDKYESDLIRLYDINIKPCRACDACQKNGGPCVIKDGLESLTGKINGSDVLVLGTPIYWWGTSAGFKAFMDRWYSPELRQLLKEKKFIIVIPFEDSDEKTADYAVGMLRSSLEYIGAEIIDIIISPATAEPGKIEKYAEVVDRLKGILAAV